MAQIVLDIDLEDARWSEALPDIVSVAEKVKKATFDYVCANTDIAVLNADKPLLINVCFSSDSHVHQLNKNFRNKDKPTNVLTFANIDYADFGLENEAFAEIDLGSIIIAFETMQVEAQLEKITLQAHLCHLLVHGFLHILGFDHIEDDEAEYMEGFEKEILQSIGIANPYQDEC